MCYQWKRLDYLVQSRLIDMIFRYKIIVYTANSQKPQTASSAILSLVIIWTLAILLTLSRKSHWGQKKLLHMGPWNSKSLGDFLQHMQKSEFFNQVFWRNCDLKFFPYKTSHDRKARITKWSVWRSGWNKKSH